MKSRTSTNLLSFLLLLPMLVVHVVLEPAAFASGGSYTQNPARNIEATDGTFPDKVAVSWDAPQGGAASYTLYRQANCGGTPIASNLTSPAYNDFAVTPGVKYVYSVKAKSSSAHGSVTSVCCDHDPGYALIGPPVVSATDGTFTNKVVVTWVPPAPSGPITGYKLYRDTVPNTPCTVPLDLALPVTPEAFDDFDVVPGVIYYYSVRGVTAAGNGLCSNIDPGYALTECSDGIDNDGDGLSDLSDPGCDGPGDTDENDPDGPACDDGIDNDGDGKIDFSVDGTGDRGCDSPGDPDENDPDFPICSDGFDNDGDGKIDFKADGTGDAGCDSPGDPDEHDDDPEVPLLSPAFAKFNTFLGQWNFAEIVNHGDEDQNINIAVFNLRGELMIERSYLIKAEQEMDVDVNSLVDYACKVLHTGCDGFQDLSATVGAPNGLGRPDGLVDTYGLVRFTFNTGGSNQRLVGRMSFYRPNVDGTYSFAFAREFTNPLKGNGYAGSNTFDPRGQGFLVPNWAEVISFGKRDAQGNLTLETQSFTLNIYDQNGALKFTKHFSLPGLGELDIQAGHEFVNELGKVVEGVYLVELVPDDPKAEYFLSVARYSSNAPPATDPETYNFAFSVEGYAGSTEPLFAPISNTVAGVQGLKEGIFGDNWIEIACTSAEDCALDVRFRADAGNVINTQQLLLKSKSQIHFNGCALLGPKSSGSVELAATAGSVIGQSMTYLHGDLNDLQSGFGSPARISGRANQAGTINTFLNMQNVLSVFSAANLGIDAQFSIASFNGGQFAGFISLAPGQGSGLQISNNPGLNFPADTFGALILSTPSDRSLIAEVRRVRLTPDGGVDFVMRTLVK